MSGTTNAYSNLNHKEYSPIQISELGKIGIKYPLSDYSSLFDESIKPMIEDNKLFTSDVLMAQLIIEIKKLTEAIKETTKYKIVKEDEVKPEDSDKCIHRDGHVYVGLWNAKCYYCNKKAPY